MKNNLKFITFLFFWVVLIGYNKIYANEILFNASEIRITDNGNTTNTGPGSAYSQVDNIKINGQSFKFDKNSSILTANNAKATLSKKNIEIIADQLIYNQKISTIEAIGNTEVRDLSNNIILRSEEITYNISEKIILSNVRSTFVDRPGNNFITEQFFYTLDDNLLKISKTKIIDIQNNTYYIERGFLNLITNKLIGKDISVDFNSLAVNNEPRIIGKTVSSDKDKTVIEKGIFTTCKKNDDCPPWEFSAEEIKHDKDKQIINYKNAWLKIYDKKVFYFPRFFHPDPTVKRQSGFLMPTFQDSSSLGASLIVPYYKVLSDNKDLTINPRLYSNEKILLQTEYRQVNATTNHSLDFSIMSESGLTNRSHFFSNSFKKLNFSNFDDSELSLKVEQTSNDTYLKTYKIESPIIKDTSLLESSLNVSAYRDDLSFDTSFQVYEDLTKDNTDRYEFILPSYSLFKKLENKTKINGNFLFNSSGYLKNYDTNIYDKVLINDLIFNSDSRVTNSGFRNNYNLLIKNTNTDSKNSKKYKATRDHKLASIVEYNSSYPLKKETGNFKNTLKPMLSLKYSPNNSKDMKNEDRRIDVNNIFSLNRIGSNESIEGGASLSFGTEFSKTDFTEREIFKAKIANVLRFKEDKNLPINSSLGKKTSDIVGSINYNPIELIKIDYEFSQNENLKDTNYQLFKNEIKVNNFISTFEYFNENNTLEKKSYISNKTVYNFNDTKSIAFEGR